MKGITHELSPDASVRPASLRLGLWAPTLTEQGFGPFLGADLEAFEADDTAISRLHARGLITYSQHVRARERLAKKIATVLRCKVGGAL